MYGYWKGQRKSLSIQASRGAGYLTGRAVLVDNEPKNAITYTKATSTSSREMYDIAKKLATLIEQDTKRITIGDKRDFWILTNSEKAIREGIEKRNCRH